MMYSLGECSLQGYCEIRNEEEGLYWFHNQEELAHIVLRMYEILEKLFEHNIFHSDIKPENFILDKSSDWRYYTLKIIDFGVSGVGDFRSFRGYTP